MRHWRDWGSESAPGGRGTSARTLRLSGSLRSARALGAAARGCLERRGNLIREDAVKALADVLPGGVELLLHLRLR